MKMQRWKIEELYGELRADAARRILFVEGNRDISFWRRVVSVPDRKDTVVYPISVVEIDGVLGGERGRLISFANQVANSPFSDRILFFADSDFDRILEQAQEPGVIYTDGRDLESYCLLVDGLKTIGCDLYSRPDDEAEKLSHLVETIARPMAILRAVSARGELNLPFQAALAEDGGRRFTKQKRDKARTIDVHGLIESLVKRCDGMHDVEVVGASFEVESEKLQHINSAQLVHGKDFVSVLSWHYSVDRDAMSAMIFAAIYIHIDAIKKFPALSAAEEWVRAA